jgi:hypothetical protein
MNIPIESSLSAWLRSAPALDSIPVFTGQNSEVLPADQPILIVAVDSTDLIVRRLYKASATIVLATPSLLEGGIDMNAAISGALRETILTGANLAESFAAPFTLAGADMTAWTEAQQDGRWITTATLTLGLLHSQI